MGNRRKGRRRYVHPDLDEWLRAESKKQRKREMEIMKELGLKLKKKKKKQEWRDFPFRV